MQPLEIVMLTQDNCGYCEEAKGLFQRLRSEFQLSVSEVDLNTPEGQALAERGGILFPPGIFIGGEPFCYGRPSERKIRRAIEQRMLIGEARLAR